MLIRLHIIKLFSPPAQLQEDVRQRFYGQPAHADL